MKQLQLEVGIELVGFLNFVQNCEGGFSVVNAPINIKFGVCGGRRSAFLIYKLINALDVLPINANWKSALTSQVENFRFAGVCLQSNFASLLFPFGQGA